jgi:uncharacterized membrane protein
MSNKFHEFSRFIMILIFVLKLSDLSAAINCFTYSPRRTDLEIVAIGSLVLKTLLSKLFRIDADTLIAASTALICSPPFVPMMAGALKNKQVMVTGITIGIIGYAVGNYLGVTIAYILNAM